MSHEYENGCMYHMKLLDEKLICHDEQLTNMLNNQQDVHNTQTGIQGTLELILDQLTALEKSPNKTLVEEQPGGGLLPILARIGKPGFKLCLLLCLSGSYHFGGS